MNYSRQNKIKDQKPVQLPRYLNQLLALGENEQLDFKKEITSVHKIAKTIVSFANVKGGTLLVGVNDDKSISGIKTEEEKFMLQQAALHYCNPTLELNFKEWVLGKKSVLEVTVPEGNAKPYYAKDEFGKWWVYIRYQDKSLLASKVILEVLKRNANENPTLITYSSKEKALMQYLLINQRITIKQFCKLVNISRWRAIQIIVNLVRIGVLQAHLNDNEEYYTAL